METTDRPTAYPLLALLRDLRPLIRRYRWKFWAATVLMLIGQAVWLYPPFALAQLVTFFTHYTPGTPLTPVGVILALWLGASVVHYVGQEVAAYWGYQVSERAALDAMFATLRHLLLLDLRWQEKENSGNKLKRIQKGGEGIDRIIRLWFDVGLDAMVNFVGMILVIARFDLRIAAAVVVFLVTYNLLSAPLTRRAGKASNATNKMEEEMSGLMSEIIGNVRSVKVLRMMQGLLAVAQLQFDAAVGKILTRIRIFRARGAVLNMTAQAFRLGLVAFIVVGVARGRYEIGFLVLFYSYFNYVWESIDKLSRITLDFVIAKYGVMRMHHILRTPLGIDREDGKQPFPEDWQSLTVENLSFAYGGKRVLDGVSFSIHRGERIGIVGLSGAGKSTLFKLLLKEHEHYEGSIRVDDVPLKDISRSSLFRHTAVVLQDTEVFNFPLRDNIALANPDRRDDLDLLERAVEVAHVNDFLHRLPQGLATVIGEKGIRLSGGEKQRLGIARAVFKEPQILFLDEATSHLDLESEAKIRDSLHQFFQSVTAVVIAHRLTTIREMDRILVIEDGRILEQGSFEELMATHGRFRELWERQRL